MAALAQARLFPPFSLPLADSPQPDDPDKSLLEAWLMDEDVSQPQLPHRRATRPHRCAPPLTAPRRSPNVRVSPRALASLGVLSWHLPPGEAASEERLTALRAARGYSFEDTLRLSRASLGEAYDAKLGIFFTEHIHSDEEVRYVLEGGGYFDVRCDCEGQALPPGVPPGSWVRVATRAGDLIILPAGMYHRFTLDAGEAVVARRLFVGEPVWTPINRGEEADAHPSRAQYKASQCV